jgi:hypothetical protein
MENFMPGFLISIGILIVLFFLFREIMCWYYKINDIIKLQEDQLMFQKKTVQLLEKLVKQNGGSLNGNTAAKNETD